MQTSHVTMFCALLCGWCVGGCAAAALFRSCLRVIDTFCLTFKGRSDDQNRFVVTVLDDRTRNPSKGATSVGKLTLALRMKTVETADPRFRRSQSTTSGIMELKRLLMQTCSLSLFFTGANLFTTRCWSRVLLLLTRGFFAVAACRSSRGVLRNWNKNGLSITSVMSAAFLGGYTVSSCLLFARRRRLESLVERLLTGSRASEMKRLLWWTVALVLLTHVANFIEAGTSVKRVRSMQVASLLDYLEMVLRLIHELASDWIPTQCVFYWILVQMLTLHVTGVLASLDSQDKSDVEAAAAAGHKNRFSHFVHAITCIRRLMRESDDLLSFLPLLWFLYGFAALPAMIVRTITREDAIVELHFATRFALLPVVTAYGVARAQERVAAAVDALTERVMLRDDGSRSSSLAFLVHQMQEIKGEKLTGGSFFQLDRRFTVSYVGSLLTFAALASSYLKTKD